MMGVTKRRLDHKISQLKSQFADIEHQRDLLRSSYIHARAGEDQDLTADLTLMIRAHDKQMDAVAAEIRSVSYRRYYAEKENVR